MGGTTKIINWPILLTQICCHLFKCLKVFSLMPDENGGNTVMASQLNNIRMKLEEKRRHIENEKRRMEVVMSKQRQKVGKAAFLQAVTKVKNTQDHYEHNSTMYNTHTDPFKRHY